MMKDRPSPIISRSKSIQSELNRVAHSFRSRKNTQEDIPPPKLKTQTKMEDNEAVSLSSLRAMEELLTVPSPTNTLTFKNSINNLSYLDRSNELIPRYFPSPSMQTWDVHRRGPSAPTGGFQSYSLHSTHDLTNLSSHNSDGKLNSTVSELSLPKDMLEGKVKIRSFTNKSYSYDDLVNSQGQNIPPSLPAPAPAMYWSVVPSRGQYPTKPLRAHSAELVGDLMYVFGGCNSKGCFNDLFIFDTDTMYWRKPIVSGTPPLPSRAHSSTLIDDKMYIFGGGNGDQYYNSLHIFDTVTLRWNTPHTLGNVPCPRRAHSACTYKGNLYIFGGGDGMRALNDVYILDLSDPLHSTWKKLEPEGDLPVARGYHTSNLVGSQWIVYGGSDGADCFNDIHILDLESLRWVEVNVPSPQARLSHTATLVGPFFFVVGGRDEKEYTNHLLILNLATMKWEQRKTCGARLSPRGYHTTILHDSRLYVFGGYDGKKYFNHVYILDLSASAYLPRMNNFELRTVPMAQSHTI